MRSFLFAEYQKHMDELCFFCELKALSVLGFKDSIEDKNTLK